MSDRWLSSPVFFGAYRNRGSEESLPELKVGLYSEIPFGPAQGGLRRGVYTEPVEVLLLRMTLSGFEFSLKPLPLPKYPNVLKENLWFSKSAKLDYTNSLLDGHEPIEIFDLLHK